MLYTTRKREIDICHRIFCTGTLKSDKVIRAVIKNVLVLAKFYVCFYFLARILFFTLYHLYTNEGVTIIHAEYIF
jgi:hypothetical protein